MQPKNVIQVVSDVVCPWCFIGKRRLEKALHLPVLKDALQDIAVRWTAFQLNPDAPREGWNRREYRAAKFGGIEVADRLQDRVVAAAAQEGLHFRFDLVQQTPNTFDAHRLIWLAGREGVQDAVVENLFRAYFIEGRNVGDRRVLSEIGESRGLHMDFDTDLGVAEVSGDEERARAQGVSGVPTFFLNGEAVTSGAHPPELLAAMLSAAADPDCGPSVRPFKKN
jgi:predicted DsbA family dithiol-disulfide isomerase